MCCVFVSEVVQKPLQCCHCIDDWFHIDIYKVISKIYRYLFACIRMSFWDNLRGFDWIAWSFDRLQLPSDASRLQALSASTNKEGRR